MRRTIDVGFKLDPLFRHFAQSVQTHHLKPARIRQNRPLPIHKPVQAPKRCDTLGCGTQHQMIGIAQQNISTRRTDIFGQHGFHSRGRAHWHESGRANVAARGRDDTRARALISAL